MKFKFDELSELAQINAIANTYKISDKLNYDEPRKTALEHMRYIAEEFLGTDNYTIKEIEPNEFKYKIYDAKMNEHLIRSMKDMFPIYLEEFDEELYKKCLPYIISFSFYDDACFLHLEEKEYTDNEMFMLYAIRDYIETDFIAVEAETSSNCIKDIYFLHYDMIHKIEEEAKEREYDCYGNFYVEKNIM